MPLLSHELQMRVIKEHGPPVFDAAEQRAADLAAHLPEADSPRGSHCHSGVSAGSGTLVWGFGFIESEFVRSSCGAYHMCVYVGGAGRRA